ncbi:thioredoxin fold domain-containing protein [Flagellimonas flava]|uniref:thioredoxin fold domain-containing protein n=1 Tax=Flagellimonas flava TaxID=570519 RepID=UPI0009339CD9|nr:thioredoxin fold domain-containing protein [Allomuricauda flava]
MSTSRLWKIVISLCVLCALSFAPHKDLDSKYTLILFEGSDWCMNCIRFEKNVLSSTYVKYFFSQEDIEVERIDFPQKKKLKQEIKDYNAKVAEEYDFKGIFPTILLINNSTDKVITLEYHDQSPADFVSQIKSNLSK